MEGGGGGEGKKKKEKKRQKDKEEGRMDKPITGRTVCFAGKSSFTSARQSLIRHFFRREKASRIQLTNIY